MDSQRVRILIVDHMAVEGSRRSVYRSIARDFGFEIHLIVPPSWNEGGLIVNCEAELTGYLHLHLSPVLFKFRTHRVLYLRLFSLARALQPHAVLVETEPENFLSMQTLLLKRLILPDVPICLVSSRNIDHTTVGFPYKLSFLNTLCDTLVRRTQVDSIHCRINSAQPFMAPYARRVVYLPHAVDCSVFTPLLVDNVAQGEDITIGYVGRIIERKGVNVLLEAFAQLPRRHRLVLVGDGDLKTISSIAIRHGIIDRVTFLPPVPHSRVPEIMRSLDVLVLPSLETVHWKEQFGRVLIEAMACGVPVVASDSGGIPDVVGDAGILFKTGNVEQLANTLANLSNNAALRVALQRKGREHVLKYFDTAVIARALAAELTTVRQLAKQGM